MSEALPSDSALASPGAPARPKLRAFGRLALEAAIAFSIFHSAPLLLATTGRGVDLAQSPAGYLEAERLLSERTRSGYASSDVSWGSMDLWRVLGRTASRARAALDGSSLAGTYDDHAEVRPLEPASLLPIPQCSVSLDPDSAAHPLLIGDPAADRAFTVLHEASHCDSRFSSWLSFSPSPLALPAADRAAARALFAASFALANGLAEPAEDSAPPSSAFAGPGPESLARLADLFEETAADSRALLILAASSERSRWLQSGWELWISRSFGLGQWGEQSDHASGTALGLLLSADPARIERLSPAQAERLASSLASDSSLLELAAQGWHRPIARDPAAAASAGAAALERLLEALPRARPEFRSGGLASQLGGERGLRESLAFLRSPQAPAALAALSRSLEASLAAPLPRAASYDLPGSAPLSASLRPNLGFAEFRPDPLPPGSELDSPARVLRMATALALAVSRAQAAHPEFRPQARFLRHMAQLGSGNLALARDDLLAGAPAHRSDPSFPDPAPARPPRLAP